jgi:hypothetical protein
MKAMILGRGFELPKAPAAAPRAAIRPGDTRVTVVLEVREVAIREVAIQGAATRVVTVIPAAAVGEGVRQGVDLTADNQARTSRTTRKCGR